jgi:hypothetical protein
MIKSKMQNFSHLGFATSFKNGEQLCLSYSKWGLLQKSAKNARDIEISLKDISDTIRHISAVSGWPFVKS